MDVSFDAQRGEHLGMCSDPGCRIQCFETRRKIANLSENSNRNGKRENEAARAGLSLTVEAFPAVAEIIDEDEFAEPVQV